MSKVSGALFQQVGKLGKDRVSCSVAGQEESSAGCQGYSSMAAILLGGSPGGVLDYSAGVIKSGGAVLVVLGVVQIGVSGESHLLTSLKEHSIYSSRF